MTHDMHSFAFGRRDYRCIFFSDWHLRAFHVPA